MVGQEAVPCLFAGIVGGTAPMPKTADLEVGDSVRENTLVIVRTRQFHYQTVTPCCPDNLVCQEKHGNIP